MPKATRSRVIAADRRSVWEVVSDPYHRARWWPKVSRVEDVHERARGSGSQWTDVLTTASGKGVRAEFRCLWSRDQEGYAWEQQIEGSPFAKVLTSSVTSVALEDRGDGTLVTIQADQRLRGLSRLGGFMLRRATAAQIEEALTGLERAVGEQAARG
jgi:carbon monoxide dehydrogenase subunit G